MSDEQRRKIVDSNRKKQNPISWKDTGHPKYQDTKMEFLAEKYMAPDVPYLHEQKMHEEFSLQWQKLQEQQHELVQQKEQLTADFESRSIRLHDREIKLGTREKTMSERFAKQQEELDVLRAEQLDSIDGERRRLKSEYVYTKNARKEIEADRAALESEKLRQAKEYQALLEKNAANYVEQTLKKLDSRLTTKNVWAYIWQTAGALSLIAGFIYFAFLTMQLDALHQSWSWKNISYLTLRSALLTGLIVGFARYASIASKQLKIEALKIEDRVHAINYGAFYLKTYGANADWDQVKEAFEGWNTIESRIQENSGKSSEKAKES